jgi:hypothetical protein
MEKQLVNSPDAVNFLEMARIDSGLNAMLGDPEVFDVGVKPDLVASHIALRDGAKKVSALVGDPTRSEPQKHEAAKKVADSVVDRLTKAKAAIVEQSKRLNSDGLSAADSALGPRSDRGHLHSEIRTWVREQARSSEGLNVIREAMEGSDDLAAVLWHSPRFLLGLPENTADILRFEALESRRPELYAKLSASANLEKLAGRYDAAILKVRTSFYNPEQAKAASKRVEV